MKEYLREQLREARDPLSGRNLLREYLQARILGACQRGGAMIPLAFHGGTALRFLYRIPRYSEDLDFALERKDRGYDFQKMLRLVRDEMTAEAYQVELKVSEQRTVHSAFVRFPGLLFEMGLSPHRREVIAVKIEIDTEAARGAELETTVIRRFQTLQLQHHDRASLLAGKLHAILQRSYTKGRDLFDLLWYLSDRTWPLPNLVLLNNALAQSSWSGPLLTTDNWHRIVRQRLDTMSWKNVLRDVHPFLAPGAHDDLLTKDNLIELCRRFES